MALRRFKNILSGSKNRPESTHGNTAPLHSVATTGVPSMDRIGASTSFSGTIRGDSTSQDRALATVSAPLNDPAVLHTSSSAAGALPGGPPSDTNSDADANARKYFEVFRILIVGRANAGKTTILQRVCATTKRPKIFDGNGKEINVGMIEGSIDRGEHSIDNELIFSSNPGFIFHDSCGFEAGSVDEFNKMKDFVLDRATTSQLKKRIHAIWYCIPLTDYNRPIVAAERKFFQECDTKKVPVLVLLTKLDTLESNAYNELKNKGCSKERARELRSECAQQMLERLQVQIKSELGKTQFPPKNYVQLTNMHGNNADCRTLLDMTVTALDSVALQLLLVSTQQTNLHLCIEWAVKITLWKVICAQDCSVALERLLILWFPHTKHLFYDEDYNDIVEANDEDILWGKLLGLCDYDHGHLGGLHRRGHGGLHRRGGYLCHGHYLGDNLNNDLKNTLDKKLLGDKPKELQWKNVEAILKQLFPEETAASESVTHILTQYATAILIVLEYSFFLQHNSMHLNDALESAVKEYKSGAQMAVEAAISAIVPNAKPDKSDKDDFCKNIINITSSHLMSSKLSG